MTAYLIPKNFASKLAKLIAAAEEDDNVEDIINEFVGKLKKPTARKTKAKKDPDAPKRNSSAYIYYGKKRRPEAKAENPDLTFGELTKLIAKEWKDLSDKKKKPFVAKAEADKTRYMKEKEEYEESKSDGEEKPKRGKKTPKTSDDESDSKKSDGEESEEKPAHRKKTVKKTEVEEKSDEEDEEKPAQRRKTAKKVEVEEKSEEEDADEEKPAQRKKTVKKAEVEEDEKVEENDEENDAEKSEVAEPEAEDVNYEEMTVTQLRGLCAEKEIDMKGLKKKADFVAALKE